MCFGRHAGTCSMIQDVNAHDTNTHAHLSLSNSAVTDQGSHFVVGGFSSGGSKVGEAFGFGLHTATWRLEQSLDACPRCRCLELNHRMSSTLVINVMWIFTYFTAVLNNNTLTVTLNEHIAVSEYNIHGLHGNLKKWTENHWLPSSSVKSECWEW